MAYLAVHSYVDDGIVADARLGEQRRHNRHARPDGRRIAELLDQREHRVWRPGDHEGGNHHAHHYRDAAFAAIAFADAHRTLLGACMKRK